MQKQLVTKDNSLIGASYSLGVVEQRLIFLAIIEAREQKTLIEAGGLLRIYAQSYAKQFDVEKHTSYEAMKRAVEGLYEAGFAYSKLDERTGKIGHYKSRWVDKIGYIDDLGCVELVFASDVIPLITRLEARYTEYELKQVVGLQSEYAIRLYELVIQWRSVRKTNLISLSELREKLGLVDEYKRIEAFKRRVLDLAVKQINEHTDITVEYEQHKQGRVITGFTFKFRIKTQTKKLLGKKKDGDMPDILTTLEMTDKQKGLFAAKLSKMSELANYAKQGEDYKADMFTVDGLTDKQLWRISRHKEFISTYSGLAKGDAGKSWSAYSDFIVGEIKKDASKFSKKRPIREYLDGNEEDYDFSR